MSDPTPLPTDFASLSFEDAFEQLQELTQDLESDSLPLEEALQAFETASLLHRRCQQLLQAAEERIQVLQNGAWEAYDDPAES